MLHAKAQQSKIWMGLAATITTVALIGCGGGEPDPAPSVQSGSAGTVVQPGGGGGMPGPAMPGAATQPQGQQTAAAPPGKENPAPGYRKDPFRPWFSTTPPPPNVLTLTEPVRIAMTGTTAPEVQPGVEIQEVPSRRVAGILNGNGVYALLDGGPAGPEVVKPGQLLDDGYRVVMINSNSVTLQKKVNTQTYTQVVPLSDAGGASTMAAPPSGFRAGRGPGFGGPGMGGPPGGPSRAGAAGGAAVGAGE
jgi:hypothetical protein